MIGARRIVAIGVLVVLALGAVALTKSFFVVRPDQYAILTQFGDPRQVVTEAGLYWKTPFVQEVRYLDARVRGWDDTARDTKTAELRTIDFTAFARWRISDPLVFYKAVRTEKRAHASLDSVVTARIQATVRENPLASIVRDLGRPFEEREELDLRNVITGYDECNPDRNKEIAAILEEKRQEARSAEQAPAKRSEIVRSILQASNAILGSEFGIEILDLHFKYLNYSPQVHQKMIDSIRADREKDIAAYRKIGKACVGSIQQTKQRRLGEIQGERDREVRRIDGEGLAKAIGTKASAFNEDPEFFRFLETLLLYEHSLDAGTRLVLSADSPLLSLLSDPTVMAPVSKLALPPPARAPALPSPTPAAEVPPEGGNNPTE